LTPNTIKDCCLTGLGIVIPTLNAADTIRETLQSVRGAIALGATSIIVDGGSHDETVSIAKACGVPCIFTPGTMYDAINAGVLTLKTPWLTWINADDILYPDGLAYRLHSPAIADIVYGTVDFIDRAGRFVHCWQSAAPQSLLTLYRAGYSPLLQQGTIFRRTVFDEIGGFDRSLRFVGDADFWWRAAEQGYSFARHPWPPAAAFRLHSKQLSQRYAMEMKVEHSQMALGRPRTGRIRAAVALFRYRIENLRAYALRWLRRPYLDGHRVLPGSYDYPQIASHGSASEGPQ
jgi:glycosyltransferase involved in cell wall biosynthesis